MLLDVIGKVHRAIADKILLLTSDEGRCSEAEAPISVSAKGNLRRTVVHGRSLVR